MTTLRQLAADPGAVLHDARPPAAWDRNLRTVMADAGDDIADVFGSSGPTEEPPPPDHAPPVDGDGAGASITAIERAGGRTLDQISTELPAELLCGRMDPTGHTILYGTGGVGKGAITTWWIVQLVRAGHRVLIADYEDHAEEWARRFAGLQGADGRDAVLHVSPLAARWEGRRGAIWTQAEELRAAALEHRATFLVVDSLVPAAAGADPTEPGTVARYAGALQLIGLPALSLGHTTKEAALEYPFGSVFWHNLARVTWSLQRDGERAILTNRKANNYRKAGKFVVSATWFDGVLREVSEQGYTMALWERIASAFGEDLELTVEQLVGRLNREIEEGQEPAKADSVRAALRRGVTSDPKRFTVTDEKWRRADV